MSPDDTIGCFDMLEANDAVVAGVSGGADSMALLHRLCALRQILKLTVYAAHINHGLRGAEAQQDEDYVRKCCGDWQVECFVLKADVASEAERTGETVEEAGRRVRYDFFEQTARRYNAKIATAHTLSDSIETVLLNLTRGTGLKGICGIPPVRGNIIRPLLAVTRGQIEEYCRKNAISYKNDSTNFSRDYTRNKIRLDVVPVLYEINPAFDRAAQRAIQSFIRDESMLSRLTHDTLQTAKRAGGEYDIPALLACPSDLIHRVLAQAALEATGSVQESTHVALLLELIRRQNGAAQIKNGYFAHVCRGRLIFSKTLGGQETIDFDRPFAPGHFQNSICSMEISILSVSEFKNLKNINKQYFNNTLDCDKIIGTAAIRSRRPGESYSPAGRNLTKSLKKLFNEAAVPVEKRGLIPVISDEKGIVWIYSFGPDERCKVTEDTKRVILIKTADVGG